MSDKLRLYPEEQATAKEANQPLRVGELAKRTKKTVRALHLYEELGLLHPLLRSKGGFRLYAQSAITRVHWITKLQDMGFSLTEIRALVSELEQLGSDSAPGAMAKIRELFKQKLEETRLQRLRLESLEAELKESLEYLETCKTCDIEEAFQACTDCSLHERHHLAPELITGFRSN